VDRRALLALMDLNWQEMTREVVRATPGGWIVERGGLVMCGTPLGTSVTNVAMVAAATDAATVRAETDRVYRDAGLAFSVWTRAHADDVLERALPAVGLFETWATPAMALEASSAAAVDAGAAGVSVRPVGSESEREAYGGIMAEAYALYGTPRESTRAHFARMASVVGPSTQSYLAWDGTRAVAGATLYLSHGVGGIGWVGTLPDAGRRGFGMAVTGGVIRAGLARGARFLNLQASPMGEPLYRRMGFSTPTHYRVFVG
jgi:hypothetical protein